MDVVSIITLIVICSIALERTMKHIKKSKCLGNEIEFSDNQPYPDYPDHLPNNITNQSNRSVH